MMIRPVLTAAVFFLVTIAVFGQVPPPQPPVGPADGPLEEGVAPPPVRITRNRYGRPLRDTFKPETLTDQQVADSVTKGVNFLLERLPSLIEEEKPRDPGAGRVFTSSRDYYRKGSAYLTIYTLLYAGHETGDDRLRFNNEKMKPAVEFLLKKEDKPRTYEQSLQACALAQLPDKPEFRRALTAVRDQLIVGMGKEGGYTYGLQPTTRSPVVYRSPGLTNVPRGFGDHSNAQYGLYGVWAVANAGVEVPMAYWRTSDDFWRKMQLKDGGWGYVGGYGTSRASMTAAGIASLYVTDEHLNTANRLEPRKDPAMESGLAQLIKTFDPNGGDLYYMYSLERVGLASGLKFFGDSNWFRAGAASIMNLQVDDGSFTGSYGPSVSTSYSVLFLLRGRAPVVMNKLQHNGNWNNRTRDSANLAGFYSRKLERHVNWQVVPLTCAYTEWLDAPVLLITGSKDPQFTDDDIEKLRQFVLAGGIVFSSADGSREPFTIAMKKYASKIANNRYEMRPLPPDHPLLNVYSKIKTPTGQYLGLSNGVREWWVHSTGDMPAIWHSRGVTRQEAFDFPLNLYWYATGKRPLRNKLQPLSIPAARETTQKITIARLDYPGNSDPEPGAWPRFAKWLASQCATELTLETPRADKLDVQRYPLTHLTGTTRFTFPDRDVLALKTYLDNGGTLFVDACGADPGFVASVHQLIATMYPDAKIDPLADDHPIYKGGFTENAKTTLPIDYRRFWVENNRRKETGSLYVAMLKDRPAIIFSELDITSGLLGTETWGINGYAPASALALTRNIVLYANASRAAK